MLTFILNLALHVRSATPNLPLDLYDNINPFTQFE